MIPRSLFEEALSISQEGVLVSSIEINVHKEGMKKSRYF
jgi:hypothetical protein